MYLAIVARLMMIFPAGSIGLEAASANAGVSAALVAKLCSGRLAHVCAWRACCCNRGIGYRKACLMHTACFKLANACQHFSLACVNHLQD